MEEPAYYVVPKPEEDEVDNGINNIAPPLPHANITTQVEPPAAIKTKPKRGLTIYVQVGILAVVAIILFLVIHNMEPLKSSTVGQLSDQWRTTELYRLLKHEKTLEEEDKYRLDQ